MPHHRETRILPFTPEELYALVADVRRYPEFLPWCVATRVYDVKEREFMGDMVIGYRALKECYTSRVTLDPPRRVTVDYIKGPLKHLSNEWRFEPAGEGRTKLDFCIDFAFRNKVFEKLMGAFFDEAFHRMVSAFEARAYEIYGAREEKISV